jgi:hypothetical protein
MSTTPGTSFATREPLITVASIVAFCGAVITLLVAFGVELTVDQVAALAGVVSVAAPLIVAFVAHRQVSPSSQIVAQVDGKSGEVVAGQASQLPTGLILEPGATVEEITP